MRSSLRYTWLLVALFYTGPSSQADIAINAPWLQEVKLNVTECRAEGGSMGLNCHGEGFFISGFEKSAILVGSTEAGTWIPASPSDCCRPDVPQIPQVAAFSDGNIHPVSIVSVGCHISANPMSCEASGSSFAVGFVDTFSPKNSHVHVPQKGITCCTPVLLMSSGDIWSLKPCHCTTGGDHGRNGNCDSGKLLRGFGKMATIQNRRVPVPPVECCDLCLGDVLYDTTQCNHLNSCHGNGACIMGYCECYPDWIGEDCSQRKEEFFAEPTLESSVWWLGGLGFIGAFFCLFATFWIIRRTEQEGPGGGSDRGLLGLLHSYVTDTGSVGSADTIESERSEIEEGDRERGRELKSDCTGDNTGVDGAAEEEAAYEPLLQMSCCLCETHPVQVTLVPCGHSNLCRKCSRKLTSCPFCRRPIVRRQRLFLSV